MKSGAQQWSNQEFPGWESGGAAGQIEEVGPGLFSALLPGTDIDAVWVAELQRCPGPLSMLSSMLTLLTRCPLASPPCARMSVCERFWRCEGGGVHAVVSVCLSDPWLAWDCVCVWSSLCSVCSVCISVAAVCPPPVCLWDNQPLPATTETEGTGQECLSLTEWRMPRCTRTHTNTHTRQKNTHICWHIQVALLFTQSTTIFNSAMLWKMWTRITEIAVSHFCHQGVCQSKQWNLENY